MDTFFYLEWQTKMSLVLRKFINANYKRNSIYNEIPLNTEFRIFYDFENNKVLGIYNYWDTETMPDNLYNQDDLIVCKRI